MFPKGPRFPTAKVPDVPGPATYNPQDPEYDTYKRGAFLEKTNRFFKGKASDVPGPGSYDPDGNPSSKSVHDRYVALQRKVEELEKLHVDSKKSHDQELERLRTDLKLALKNGSEQTERADKLKRQLDLTEAKNLEMKKSATLDKAQIRELGMKLRSTEHERTQCTCKQEAAEARRALQTIEAKHKNELREKDARISELSKGIEAEKRQKDLVALKLRETLSVAAQRDRTKLSVEESLREVQAVSEKALSDLEEAKTQAAKKQQGLTCALRSAAKEYGRLASSTISKSPHHKLKRKNGTLQVLVFHLERKLANAEAQVQELAHLVRYTKNDNAFLATQLKEVEEEVAFYRQAWKDCASEKNTPPDLSDLERELADLERDTLLNAEETMEALALDSRIWDKYHRLKSDSLLLHSSTLLKGLLDTQALVDQTAVQLSDAEQRHAELLASLDALSAKYDSLLGELEAANTSLALSKAAEQASAKQLERARAHTEAEVAKVEQNLQREKEAAQRLSATLQKSRIAEEALREEIQKLMEALEEAERYRDAYSSLAEEVEALVARNALAEDEAQRLSRFNAEIVGHNNPAQRIVYVDKIRRELHETKQQLLMSIRDRDTVQMENDGLRHELQLYKSISVPQESKPRTALTRIPRMPPASQSAGLKPELKVSHTTRNISPSPPRRTRFGAITNIDYSRDEMTLDEII
ncbi:hypothetical protein CERSUDRAFT_154518 [Gelatoporia subvermispora B]|uniref:Hyaluronan-mediated motility receptor C-terminal domain-containing protein n=1 Tax=Ceriporiopsis subvermispora (strain B) TaxID=914234 RepID=M2PMS2_CERS8|nr:hypothetical protein CERSUDRAFT_154518 [Gelatoporia subvermispora B]